MDIFTTVLTRVVPIPIKPTSLKVKALLKDAATNGLFADPYHLENHEYYFTSEDDTEHQSPPQSAQHEKSAEPEQSTETEHSVNKTVSDNDKSDLAEEETIDKDKHLDLYA